VSALRFGQVVLACAALGSPFALVASSAGAFVEPLSRAAVGALLSASSALSAPSAPRLPPEPLELDAELPPSDALASSNTKPAGARAGRAGRAIRPQSPAALFVSAAKVLRLSQGSARPQGELVAATAQHPAGLRLSGVAALGIGVQDGDILVEALGAAPRSPGQIIGGIIEARAQRARYLSGTLWRRGQTLKITVEQPYLQAAAPEPTAALTTP
jgi:hypothetical protein